MGKLSSEEYSTVLSFFEKELKKDPTNYSYWYDIGFCKGRLGRWDEATEALEKARTDPSQEPAVFNALGHAYIKTKRYDDAVDVLKNALQHRPKSPNLLYKLAAAHFGKGELETAKSTILKILTVSPNFIKAHFGLGLVCYYLDDSTGYQEQMEILNNLNPDLSKKLSCLTKNS